MSEPDFYVRVYKGKAQGRQAWRWRAINAGNSRIMATGAEAYTNAKDCMKAVTDLFSAEKTVHMTFPHGGAVLREGQPSVACPKCGHGVAVHDAGCGQCDCAECWSWQ